MSDDIEKKAIDRFKFLKRLYEIAESQSSPFLDGMKTGKELGFPIDTTKKICEYLENEGLIEDITDTTGEVLRITHMGLREVETALNAPDVPTEHFPPYNVIINLGTVQVQFVEGTQNNANQIAAPETSQTDRISSNIENARNPKVFWKQKLVEIVLIILGGVIVAYLVYKFGWNR